MGYYQPHKAEAARLSGGCASAVPFLAALCEESVALVAKFIVSIGVSTTTPPSPQLVLVVLVQRQ
jgi:hypothetical protein